MVVSSPSDGYRVAADAAAAWWNGLSDNERRREINRAAVEVGRQDGLPVAVRDEVNRARLDRELVKARRRDTGWRRILAWLGRIFHRNLAGRCDYQGLRYLQSQIDQPSPTGQRYLLVDFDASGDGEAVVALGDPDTARYVGVYVPGTTAMLADTSFRGPDDDFHRFNVLASDAAAQTGDRVAMVFWLGYDAPNDPVLDAGFESYAVAAADALSGFAHGLRVSHQGGDVEITMLGHSYGSTVIGVTARERGLDVDAMIFIGSPGLGEGIERAADLGIDPDRVWASVSDDDVIEMVDGWHGASPVSEEFGARVFHSEPAGHDGYWYEANRAGRETMARIITGTR